jgi:sarcosine oxidase, subunit beta
MSGASVAVVGGGVIGASVAYHLAVRGIRDVVILDRAAGPGEGSTGRATGGFRAQFASAINVRLSLLAREKLLRFGQEIGADAGYLPAGYLWLAGTEAELAELRASRVLQQAEGLHEAVEVESEQIARLNPALRLDGLIGGTYCPTDGFIEPGRILEGYLAAARRHGVRIEWQTETSRGVIGVDGVVNAAGAWAAPLARMAGVDLPVTPLRRQVAITTPCDLLPPAMPMTIFAGDGFHLRVRDGRVMLLQPSPGVPGQPFDIRVDPAWIDAVTKTAHRRVPVLQRAAIDRPGCWAGLYEVSPDKHAILGAAAGCANLFLINGSSGHGVMHAPALGQLLAEIICDGQASTLDVTALRPSRFDEGAPNPVSGLL